MATLTKQTISRSGIDPSYASCSGGGDEFVPDDRTFLHVLNGSGGSLNVTIVTPKTIAGQAIADVTVAVPASGERLIGPFPANHYANPSDGKADVTYSGVTSLTIACLELSEG